MQEQEQEPDEFSAGQDLLHPDVPVGVDLLAPEVLGPVGVLVVHHQQREAPVVLGRPLGLESLRLVLGFVGFGTDHLEVGDRLRNGFVLI